MDKDAKIYVAGHRGLVGSAIYQHLIDQGYTNVIGKTSQELDLTDAVATDQFFADEKPDYVFLAAAKVGGIMANNTYRADFIHTNLQIQSSVIGASYKHGVKKLLFLGSSCIYPKEAPQPIEEMSLLTGELEYTNEPYAIAKIAGIKECESFNIQYGTDFISVMPTNLYGHNDNFDLEKSHVLPALIRKIYLCKLLEENDLSALSRNLGVNINSKDHAFEQMAKYGIAHKDDGSVILRVWGTGKPRREFMHSDDMAEACLFIMNNLSFSDLTQDMKEIRNTHLNIGTGSDVTIKEIAYMIKEIIGFQGTIEFDPSKPDGTLRKLLNVDKINSLGWRHKIDLEAGLKQTIDWYRTNQNA